MKISPIEIFERGLSIVAFIFPFIELSYYFGAKVFLSTESFFLKSVYLNYIQKLSNFYAANIYFIFILMVGVFIICSRGTLPLSKYARFNIIQAILLNIICSCLGSIFMFLPIILRESAIGVLMANFLYLGLIVLILYSSLLIFYGRYPTIPVVSEAAKLQVQQY
jgi:hypothetical protein|tara:strand:- start:526 stop:1020 length:495 start_codon:yes stop_codon:yes gene_type:complete